MTAVVGAPPPLPEPPPEDFDAAYERGTARRVGSTVEPPQLVHELKRRNPHDEPAPNPLAAAYERGPARRVGSTVEPPELVHELMRRSQEDERAPYRLVRLSELRTRPGTEWIVPGWVPRRALVGIPAPRGVGKSMSAAALGWAMATGRDWLGQPVARGTAVYVPLEGPYTLGQRGEDWARAHRVDPDELDAMAIVEESRLGLVDDDGARLEYVIRTEGADLVILDAWRQLLEGGSDRDPGDVAPLLAVLERLRTDTGASFVVLHNTGWDAPGRARGASEWEDAMDVVLTAEPWADGHGLRLRQTKNRLGPLGEEVLSAELRDGTVVAVVDDAQDDADDRLLRTVALTPGQSITALARALDTRKETVGRRVHALADRGRLTLVPGPRSALLVHPCEAVSVQTHMSLTTSPDRSGTGGPVEPDDRTGPGRGVGGGPVDRSADSRASTGDPPGRGTAARPGRADRSEREAL